MNEFESAGERVRGEAMTLVLDYLRSSDLGRPGGDGVSQTQIFRACGLDWGAQRKATSTNQQYWVVALLRQLERDGKVEQVRDSGPWRLL